MTTRPTAPAPVYSLVPVPRLSLETVARRSGLHPELVRRFVALGLVDADRDAHGKRVPGDDRVRRRDHE